MAQQGHHLRYAACSDEEQGLILTDMLRSSKPHMRVLMALAESALHDPMMVSGAIYNFVWNRLTGRPDLSGIKDFDLFYFDATDLSYEAEDVEIKRMDALLKGFDLPIELRNQARVPLWYEAKFGRPFPPLANCAESLERFASRTHAVGARLDARGEIELIAPFGLREIFAMRIVPNGTFANPKTHVEKAERAKRYWPELEVLPFDEEPSASPARSLAT